MDGILNQPRSSEDSSPSEVPEEEPIPAQLPIQCHYHVHIKKQNQKKIKSSRIKRSSDISLKIAEKIFNKKVQRDQVKQGEERLQSQRQENRKMSLYFPPLAKVRKSRQLASRQ